MAWFLLNSRNRARCGDSGDSGDSSDSGGLVSDLPKSI
jgi:hypothetical protein